MVTTTVMYPAMQDTALLTYLAELCVTKVMARWLALAQYQHGVNMSNVDGDYYCGEN